MALRVPSAALLGSPVAHSLSPEIFQFLASRARKNVRYIRLDVEPRRLPGALRSLRRAGFSGANVTAPLKQDALRLADRLSPEAETIGAVNALRFDKSRLFAHNTDGPAFLSVLKESGAPLKGQEAVVFGAGGAARAVCWALHKAGLAKVVVAARKPRQASVLASRMSKLPGRTVFRGIPWREAGAARASIWINATPAGMRGVPGRAVFPLGKGAGKAFAFDLIYLPPRTPFLRQAAARGMRTVPGLGMLVKQAVASWELWFGPLAAKAAVEKRLMVRLRAALR